MSYYTEINTKLAEAMIVDQQALESVASVAIESEQTPTEKAEEFVSMISPENMEKLKEIINSIDVEAYQASYIEEIKKHLEAAERPLNLEGFENLLAEAIEAASTVIDADVISKALGAYELTLSCYEAARKHFAALNAA